MFNYTDSEGDVRGGKVIGFSLMSVILLAIVTSTILGTITTQYATSGTVQFLNWLSLICLFLFGSLSALTLDKLN